MSHALVIWVRFHDGRYHGVGDWPPSPARLFQALVGAAGLNGKLAAVRDALEWLEKPPSAPIIGAPNARRGQRVMFYMPNNDLDAVQGDPRQVAKIRTAKKFFAPWLFDALTPFLYVWQDIAVADERHAQAIISLADHLYQFGRGIDMAWAWGEVLDARGVDEVLTGYPGLVYRPSAGGGGVTLPCPRPGSLASTRLRYEAYRHRFEVERKGRTVKLAFRQPPRPSFRSVAYESAPSRFVYELAASSSYAALASWPLVEVSKLVVWMRDAAVERLKGALPGREMEIERVLIGRKPDGTNDGPTRARVRIIPLPSIGHPHADRAIRRILIEVPADCSLRADDVAWAYSGLEPIDGDSDELHAVVVTPTSDEMLRHYGIGEKVGARTWRTVTPAALPEAAGRRRIDPAHKLTEAKRGAERIQERQRAAAAVIQALRHADVRAPVESIRVQREPFEARGDRVEAFTPGTRFPHRRLWHVEVAFSDPVPGPLVIGDGRFLGLGVLAPVKRVEGVLAFAIEGVQPSAAPEQIARALRRAVMARVQRVLGRERLPRYFHGHEADGSPSRDVRDAHLAVAFDPARSRVLLIAPHLLRREDTHAREAVHWTELEEAMQGFRELRAGRAGLLALRPCWVDVDEDPLLAPSRHWESLTPYRVTRHAKKVGAEAALVADVRTECGRRGLLAPEVKVLEAVGVPGAGLEGRVRLEFPVALRGPIVLGRSRYLGGGIFSADSAADR